MDENENAGAVEPQKPVEVDYTSKSMDELLELMGKAYKDKDMKLMGRLSKLYTTKEAEAEKAKKAALMVELARVESVAKARFDALAEELKDSGEFDGADGFWYANDFGETASAMKLMKAARKAAGDGSASKSGSYVANPAKSADLLAQVGENVMFKEETKVTIDKVEHTIPAGFTFKQAYDYSTNGGWRNRVRMAILKEAGVI